MKWYEKVFYALLCIAFLPLIIFVGFCMLIARPFIIFKDKKLYKDSAYYKDFNVPFNESIFNRPRYSFYNAMKEKKWNVQYIRQTRNRYEYFIYNGTVHLFPDFNKLKYDEEKAEWKIVYRKNWEEDEGTLENFINTRKKLLDQNIADLPIKVIVPIIMIEGGNLNDEEIIKKLFVVRDYEYAFEEINREILAMPKNTKELYNALTKTPNLSGSFELINEGLIRWENNDLVLEISEEYLSVDRKNGRLKRNLTHWHPVGLELYYDVVDITQKGNALVIKTSMGSGGVLYIGKKENSPYKKGKKGIFFEIHYFENE